MITDAELLHRYASDRSEAAFAELVQRHLALVYGTALRQVGGDAHLAQDVAQTVFTALARKAATLSDRAALAGWLYLGTHHAAAQAVRSLRRRRTREQEAHAMYEDLAPDAPPTDWDRVRPVLDDALRALGDADREAVLLRYFERRPFADIGAALNLSDDAARMRVDRALGKLRDLLARRGITSTTAALAAALGQGAAVAAPAGLAATITGTALSATAAGTVAATTGFLMSTSTVLLSVVSLAAVGSAVYQTSQARSSAEALSALTQERAALSARVSAAEQKAAQTARQNEKLERDLDQLFTAKTAPAPGPGLPKTAPQAPVTERVVTTGAQGRLTLGNIAVSSDPAEAKRQIRAFNLRGIDQSNRALYRLLGFSEAQQQQYMEIIAADMDRREARYQASATQLKGADGSLNRTAMQAAFEQTNAQAAQELQATLQGTFGESAIQTIQRYRDTLPVREVTKELVSALFYTDAPLAPAQAEQLVDVLAANARNAQGKVDLSALNLDAVAAQAQSVLSPAQLASLRIAAEQVRSKYRPTEVSRVAAPVTAAGGK